MPDPSDVRTGSPPCGSVAAAPLSIGECASLACLLEATAAKPGNVHRGADFDGMTFADLILSAAVIAPSMERAPRQRVGETVLSAVRATRAAVRQNTNLGIILLLAPLAKVPRELPVRAGIGQVLAELDVADAVQAYTAIRIAQPGALGHDQRADVREDPQLTLAAAMGLAADRDLVARQYANQYHEVLELVLPRLVAGPRQGWPLSQTIVHTHVWLLGQLPDSLIARKCGVQVAREASARAAAAVRAGGPLDPPYQAALRDLDCWLRADGHRRNPGTTADLITAGLFVGLREGQLERPLVFY
ncbi:MAG: hypothetical protein A2W31_07850 [Planctomycetes bacterium RBG_16_64_10]|nr:MAG: hypothetical protein A2W31_07850 [Planctomycetes bacterium RBG_16_64_10]